jgi:hypothetical protein
VRATVAGCLLFLVSGCAVSEQAKPSQVTYSGFLGDYSELSATDNKNQALLRYIDPAAPWSSYTAVFIEPVTFWAGSDTKLPPDVQLTLTQYAYQKFRAALEAKGVRVADQAGPGVVIVHMALTDASSATPVLRTSLSSYRRCGWSARSPNSQRANTRSPAAFSQRVKCWTA